MVTDTLQEFDRLVEAGFSGKQASAVVRLVWRNRIDPEFVRRLEESLLRLDELANHMRQDVYPPTERPPNSAEYSRTLDDELISLRATLRALHAQRSIPTR